MTDEAGFLAESRARHREQPTSAAAEGPPAHPERCGSGCAGKVQQTSPLAHHEHCVREGEAVGRPRSPRVLGLVMREEEEPGPPGAEVVNRPGPVPCAP